MRGRSFAMGAAGRLRARVTATWTAFSPITWAFISVVHERPMFSFLKSQEAANWGSALLVIIASAIVGHQAALGMEPQQWACAVVAVLGSVSVAVMVRVWPASSRMRAEER